MEKQERKTWPSHWTFQTAKQVREVNLRGNSPLLIPGETSSWPLSRLAHLSTKDFLEAFLGIIQRHVRVDLPMCASRCCVCEQPDEAMSLREYVSKTWLLRSSDSLPSELPPFGSFDTPLLLRDALIRLRAVAPFSPTPCEGKTCNGPLYLKDLHLDTDSLASELYLVPTVFEDDYLNPYFRNQYRFLYLGSSFTFTPLHADVFRSFSWTANVRGRKAWLLFPPTQDPQHLSAFEKIANLDLRKFKGTEPILDQLPSHCIFMIQPEGSAFFVPSNWYHAVYNLDDLTLSINHNWFNSTNIGRVLEHLHQQEISIRDELAAWDSAWREKNDSEERVQTILKANAAIDRAGLHALLLTAPRRTDLEDDSDRAAVATVLQSIDPTAKPTAC